MAAMDDTRIRQILKSSPTIAVLGFHVEPEKAAFYVPEYLHEEGYRVIGVNPKYTGQQHLGAPVAATLAEIREPVDLVDVFRRPQDIPGHVEDILAMSPRPKVVWFQLGIKNDEAAAILEAAGITVVQNRCTLADHQRLHMGAPTPHEPGRRGGTAQGTLRAPVADMLDSITAEGLIKPDMPVVCSENGQFATVDHLQGTDQIKLTKDKSGQHHYIPLTWVTAVDDKVHIDRPGDQAMKEWSSEPTPAATPAS